MIISKNHTWIVIPIIIWSPDVTSGRWIIFFFFLLLLLFLLFYIFLFILLYIWLTHNLWSLCTCAVVIIINNNFFSCIIKEENFSCFFFLTLFVFYLYMCFIFKNEIRSLTCDFTFYFTYDYIVSFLCQSFSCIILFFWDFITIFFFVFFSCIWAKFPFLDFFSPNTWIIFWTFISCVFVLIHTRRVYL